MKLTGLLKEKVDKAESMELAKGLIEEAGMELTDDELENVTGGRIAIRRDNGSRVVAANGQNNGKKQKNM